MIEAGELTAECNKILAAFAYHDYLEDCRLHGEQPKPFVLQREKVAYAQCLLESCEERRKRGEAMSDLVIKRELWAYRFLQEKQS